MRIQVHDFGGYAFASDLSVHLVELGHEVEHVFCAQYSANVGDFARLQRPGLGFTALSVGTAADKYSLIGRTRFELAYARAWSHHTRASLPDLVIAANVPLLPLTSIRRWASRSGRPWILWHQDLVSTAMTDELMRRFPPPIGRLGGWVLDRMERRAARSARFAVVISAAFADVYSRWGIPRSAYRVVRNWAPLSEIAPQPRDNAWAAQTYAGDVRPRVVYTGTLGRKHRPHLLTDLAALMSESGVPIHLVVVSEGPAAEALRDAAVGDSKVSVLPFQPAESLPNVLASADVLVAILEPAAAAFSIPSKVTTYLAAGRPVLGLVPRSNAAATDITSAGGFAAEPDEPGVRLAAEWLRKVLPDRSARDELGGRAREFAESAFSPARGVEQISEVIRSATAMSSAD